MPRQTVLEYLRAAFVMDGPMGTGERQLSDVATYCHVSPDQALHELIKLRAAGKVESNAQGWRIPSVTTERADPEPGFLNWLVWLLKGGR